MVHNDSLARFVDSPELIKSTSGDTILENSEPNCFFSPEFCHKGRIKELCERYFPEKSPKALEQYFLDPQKVVVIRAAFGMDPNSCGASKEVELLVDYRRAYWNEH